MTSGWEGDGEVTGVGVGEVPGLSVYPCPIHYSHSPLLLIAMPSPRRILFKGLLVQTQRFEFWIWKAARQKHPSPLHPFAFL